MIREHNLFIKLKNLQIHYKVSGSGEPIVLLHGWGRGLDCFVKLQDYLSSRFTVYALDLPGFGLSTIPESVWGSAEYADLVGLFIRELKITNPILLGHSLGGKIAVGLVAQGPIAIKKMILIGSSGVLLPKSPKVKVRIYFFKLLKFLAGLPIMKSVFASRIDWYRKKLGSRDYQSASGIMRSILVKTVNESIVELLSRIKVPTLLLWGDQDSETPLSAGKIFHQAILNSQLKIISSSGHFPFLDNWEQVKVELDSFLG
jgi:pimeloyl-ACP methyl ester carboxylesterase